MMDDDDVDLYGDLSMSAPNTTQSTLSYVEVYQL